MIIHWNLIYSNGTELNDDAVLKTLLFAHDQVLLSESEYNLQAALDTLHNTTKQFGMETSSLNFK